MYQAQTARTFEYRILQNIYKALRQLLAQHLAPLLAEGDLACSFRTISLT